MDAAAAAAAAVAQCDPARPPASVVRGRRRGPAGDGGGGAPRLRGFARIHLLVASSNCVNLEEKRERIELPPPFAGTAARELKAF